MDLGSQSQWKTIQDERSHPGWNTQSCWTKEEETVYALPNQGEKAKEKEKEKAYYRFDDLQSKEDLLKKKKDRPKNQKHHPKKEKRKRFSPVHKSGFLSHQNVRLFYQIVGKEYSQRPTLVFLHDSDLDHSVWRDQQRYFSRYTQTLAYDLRGCGQSDKPTSLSLDLHLEDLHFLLTSLKITNFILIGWSMGGSISLAYLKKYPGKAEKAILLNTAPSYQKGDYPFGLSKEEKDELIKLIEENYSGYRLSRAQALISEVGRGPDQIRKRIESLLEKNEKEIVKRQMADLFDFSLEDLSSISTPILILYGGKDPIVHPGNSLYLRQHLPNSEIYEFPLGGHAPHLIYRFSFNRLVFNFSQGRRMKYQISSRKKE